jgi:hypothetical protein
MEINRTSVLVAILHVLESIMSTKSVRQTYDMLSFKESKTSSRKTNLTLVPDTKSQFISPIDEDFDQFEIDDVIRDISKAFDHA